MTNGGFASVGATEMLMTLNSVTIIESMMTIRREDLESGKLVVDDIVDARRAPMKPLHPGEILKADFLEAMNISAYRLAKDICVPVNRIASILSKKRGITADTALRLAQYFDTDAQSWINLQARYDLEVVRRASGKRIGREVKPRAA